MMIIMNEGIFVFKANGVQMRMHSNVRIWFGLRSNADWICKQNMPGF